MKRERNGVHVYLHVWGKGFVGVAQTVPVLPAQGESYAREAVGTVLGDLHVHRLGPRWVRHGEILVQQGLWDHVLERGTWESRGVVIEAASE